jgi:hypothetical protein
MLMKNIGSVTVRLKGPMEAFNSPSETVIVMANIESRSLFSGIPVNKPEEESKVAQAGMPVILKFKTSPSGSFAVGKKFKVSPTLKLLKSIAPVILGGEFVEILPPPQEVKKDAQTNRTHTLYKRNFKITAYFIIYLA